MGKLMMSTAAEFPFLQGREFLEIFFVRNDNIDDEETGDLYGNFRVEDGLGTDDLFNLSRNEHIPIAQQDYVPMTGPSLPISGADQLYLTLDLWDHDSISADDPIVQGTIRWNAYSHFSEYKKKHIQLVTGKYGRATVSYAVMRDALAATIEITLINGDNENPTDIYGSITTCNGLGESEPFQKTKKTSIKVRPKDLIKLSRCVVAVPTDDKLKVKADLYDHDPISSDEHLMDGYGTFTPLWNQCHQQTITGPHGEVQIRVTWS
ncbi:hypothetical protein T069G_02205 [Trichoderma breve]|uniref:DUF6598 domain-containing protein n=1 Tax=Trichoderma breve TaxID=2034170 RepID=A0A9W9EFB9_9HYPO|nr:hypothetical protein T069G_02205 [Trichoderma breve]KAJ4865675.1 hypothetical protein T069G_02205 [Trichoderma breve]